MTIRRRVGSWIKEHDVPGMPRATNAPVTGVESLRELIQICATRQPGTRLKAGGSHWALSDAAVSDGEFIETNDPLDMQQHDPKAGFPALGRTLYDVVPGCLNGGALQDLDRAARANYYNVPYFMHVEAGKRIYQLYAELDVGDDNNLNSLAFLMNNQFRSSNFTGSWAFETLGGAGGQTIVGALTTGTHGGDVHLPPVADSVKAIHLVVDGGRHYWIEPERPSWIPAGYAGQQFNITFTNDAKLHNLFDQKQVRTPAEIAQFPEAGKFEIIRNDDTFNAVLVSAGRFGIIYSVVLQATRQYFLRETRSITDWETVKEALLNPTNQIFQTNRFVQIAICLTPHENGTRHKCGITVRDLSAPPPAIDLRLMAWGSTVPTSGRNLIIAGTDNNRSLHIRIFDGRSMRTTDTDEAQLLAGQPPEIVQVLAPAISTLKSKLPGLLLPHVLTEREKKQIIAEVVSIVGPTIDTYGQTERIGKIIDKPSPDLKELHATRFEKAGTSAAYNPTASGNFLDRPCSSADFMEALIEEVIKEIEDFANNHKVGIGSALATVAAIGGNSLPQLIPALLVILALLRVFLELLKHLPYKRLGQVLDLLRHLLLDQPTDPLRAAGVCIWRAIGVKLFEQEQGFHDYVGYSYAVMDTHDYTDRNCRKSVDSIEVFFDATDRKMLAFVDLVLAVEARRHFQGKAAVGYISLRYMSQSRGLIAMARHPLTVSLEVSALRDVAGSTDFVEHAQRVALNRNFGGILHWGQGNPSKVDDIERLFNAEPGGDLFRWRTVLSKLTDNGRLDGFSSDFTRKTGLEVVAPKIDSFTARVTGTALNRTITADWNCFRNPPGTTVRIDLTAPSGRTTAHTQRALQGSTALVAAERGAYSLTLVATFTPMNSHKREITRTALVNVA